MPKRKTADDLKKELNELTKKYNEKVEAEKSAKIKAQMAKRSQMLIILGLAHIAYIQELEDKELQEKFLKYTMIAYSTKYPINDESFSEDEKLSENQKIKRQKDQELLKEALQLAIENKLK